VSDKTEVGDFTRRNLYYASLKFMQPAKRKEITNARLPTVHAVRTCYFTMTTSPLWMGRGRSAHWIVTLLKFTGIPAHISGSGLSQTWKCRCGSVELPDEPSFP